MQQRTEGIVLKTFPFGEADLIVTYLTLDHGIRKAFAKSPRKIKSRFGSSLEPLTQARITFMGREDAALPRLTQSDIIRPHQGLRERYECYVRASGMAELILTFLPEGVEAHEVYAFFLAMLGRMEADCSVLNALIFRIRLLDMKGYGPALTGCVRCSAGTNRFYPSQGALLCNLCAAKLRGMPSADGAPLGDALELTPGMLRLYDSLRTWPMERIGRLKAGARMVEELASLLDAHLRRLLHHPLRTAQFVK
jgi:DNA repair protein RecO (recombination protein O)